MTFWEITALFAIFLVELIFPIKKVPFFRTGLVEDLFYLALVIFVVPYIYSKIPWGLGFLNTLVLVDFTAENFVLQFLVMLIMTDFLLYFIHRSIHQFDALWRIHRLHHSSTVLTAMSAFRNSYWDELNIFIFTTIPLSLFRFKPEVAGLVYTFLAIHAWLIHSNTKIIFPKWLRWISSPHFHHWHHAIEKKYKYGQNFGSTFTFWDKCFGSYFVKESFPEEVGLLPTEKMETNYLSRFFLPRR